MSVGGDVLGDDLLLIGEDGEVIGGGDVMVVDDLLFGAEVIVDLCDYPDIRDLLDTFTIDGVQHHAIIYGQKLPAKFQDMNRLIQIYRTSALGPGDFSPLYFTVNCRARTEQDSEEIAKAVFTRTNRKFYEVISGRYCFLRDTLQKAIYSKKKTAGILRLKFILDIRRKNHAQTNE